MSLIPAPDAEHWLISRSDAAELAAYELSQQGWMRAAAACLGSKP